MKQICLISTAFKKANQPVGFQALRWGCGEMEEAPGVDQTSRTLMRVRRGQGGGNPGRDLGGAKRGGALPGGNGRLGGTLCKEGRHSAFHPSCAVPNV